MLNHYTVSWITTADLSLWSHYLSYPGAAAGVEKEVGRVGSGRRLVGDCPVAQRHADNGSHVSFCAKDMEGDPSGLA